MVAQGLGVVGVASGAGVLSQGSAARDAEGNEAEWVDSLERAGGLGREFGSLAGAGELARRPGEAARLGLQGS